MLLKFGETTAQIVQIDEDLFKAESLFTFTNGEIKKIFCYRSPS